MVEDRMGKHHGITIVRQGNVFGVESQPRRAQV